MELAQTSAVELSGCSHMGYVREDNQDSIRLPEGAGRPAWLFALADGMGGYEHGKRASELAVDAVFRICEQEGPATALARRLQHGVEAANLSVCKEAQRLGAARMGTTLIAAGIEGHFLHLAHVGDSRAYLVRGSEAACLTGDHTVVGDLLRMRVITESQVREHAQRSILTRAVGLSLFVQPDVLQIPLQIDDRVILCTDGAWSVIEDREFARLAAGSLPMDEVCKRIIHLALERDTDDNVSVIAVRVHSLEEKTVERKSAFQKLRSVFQNLGKSEPAGAP